MTVVIILIRENKAVSFTCAWRSACDWHSTVINRMLSAIILRVLLWGLVCNIASNIYCYTENGKRSLISASCYSSTQLNVQPLKQNYLCHYLTEGHFIPDPTRHNTTWQNNTKHGVTWHDTIRQIKIEKLLCSVLSCRVVSSRCIQYNMVKLSSFYCNVWLQFIEWKHQQFIIP